MFFRTSLTLFMTAPPVAQI
jgi:hypothetical protein